MKALLFAALFMISFSAQAAFFCAKAQSSRFDDGVLQTRIDALIEAQIHLEQKDFGSQSEFEMALAYFRNENTKLHQAVPGFVARYKQRFLELKDQVFDQQTATQRQRDAAEKNRREVIRRTQILNPIEVREIPHGGWVLSINFSPDGKLIVTGSGDEKIRIIDVATGQVLREIPQQGHWVYSTSFSPDSKLLVIDLKNGRIFENKTRIIDVATGKILHEIPHLRGLIENASFSPDGKLIVTGREEENVTIIKVSTGQVLHIIHLNRFSPVRSASFSPDGRLIVTGSDDGKARIIDVTSGQILRTIHIGNAVTSASFSPDGKLIVTISGDQIATIIDVVTGQILREIWRSGGPQLNSSNFSPDGKLLVNGSSDGKVRIFDVASGLILSEILHGDNINSASFSPDGKFIVTGSGSEFGIMPAFGKARIFQLYQDIEE